LGATVSFTCGTILRQEFNNSCKNSKRYLARIHVNQCFKIVINYQVYSLLARLLYCIYFIFLYSALMYIYLHIYIWHVNSFDVTTMVILWYPCGSQYKIPHYDPQINISYEEYQIIIRFTMSLPLFLHFLLLSCFFMFSALIAFRSFFVLLFILLFILLVINAIKANYSILRFFPHSYFVDIKSVFGASSSPCLCLDRRV